MAQGFAFPLIRSISNYARYKNEDFNTPENIFNFKLLEIIKFQKNRSKCIVLEESAKNALRILVKYALHNKQYQKLIEEYTYYLTKIYEVRERPTKAISLTEQILKKLHWKNKRIKLLWAELVLCYQNWRYKEVIQKVKDIKLGGRVNAIRGLIHMLKNDFMKAEKYYKKAIILASKNIEIHIQFALFYFQKGNFQKGKHICKQLLPFLTRRGDLYPFVLTLLRITPENREKYKKKLRNEVPVGCKISLKNYTRLYK